jgi:hypothetical protein
VFAADGRDEIDLGTPPGAGVLDARLGLDLRQHAVEEEVGLKFLREEGVQVLEDDAAREQVGVPAPQRVGARHRGTEITEVPINENRYTGSARAPSLPEDLSQTVQVASRACA